MTTEKAGSERWLIASYRPTAMFSLRMTHATSKGGKTLLVPTPYAVKLALIDACFRLHASDEGYAHAARVYEMIKARKIRFCPPEHCVVQQTFIKIKQQEKNAQGEFSLPTLLTASSAIFPATWRWRSTLTA